MVAITPDLKLQFVLITLFYNTGFSQLLLDTTVGDRS